MAVLTIGAYPAEWGTTTPTPGTYTYAEGETVSATAIPSVGYFFDHWELMGRPFGVHSTISFPMKPEYDGHTLWAIFSARILNFGKRGTGDGYTDPVLVEANNYYPDGKVLTIRAIPYVGNFFDHWKLDGVSHPENPITIIMNRNYILYAYFTSAAPPPPDYATVTITMSGEGVTDPMAGTYTDRWKIGENLYVTAYPAEGWRYELMRRNGVEHTRANPGEFLNLAETEVIEVVFVEEGAPPTPPPEADLLPVAAAIVTLCLLLAGGAYYYFTYVKS